MDMRREEGEKGGARVGGESQGLSSTVDKKALTGRCEGEKKKSKGMQETFFLFISNKKPKI